MRRRDFFKYSTAGVIALSSTGLLVKSSEAFVLGFLLRSLTSRVIFGSIARGVASMIFSSLDSRSPDEVLAIQIAERDFIERQFTSRRTDYAQFRSSVFWGAERNRNDAYLKDIGFSFIETSNSTSRRTTLGSPIMTGLYAASEILQDQGVSVADAGLSIMPTRTQLQDLCSWDGGRSGTCFASYRTVLGEIFFRYDLIQSGTNGYGNISVIVDAAGFPRREIDVRVDFM